MKKAIQLLFTDYVVKGTAVLTPWGGRPSSASIPMKSFHVSKITRARLTAGLNDGGFGVEAINGAICEVFENYEGTLKYVKTVTIGKIPDFAWDNHFQNN